MNAITDPIAFTITVATLPAIGQALQDGIFSGITTLKDDTHAAVVLLADKPASRLNWQAAKDWAKEVGGQLPTRPIAALLYTHLKPQFETAWHWTADELQGDTGDEEDASYAWNCYFGDGLQHDYRKSYEGRARAVRLIQLTA